MQPEAPKILLSGSTGFVGGRLLHALSKREITPRCMVRSAHRFRKIYPGYATADLVEADLLQPQSLDRAFEGIDIAYYLVHSMGGRTFAHADRFAERDRQAAANFVRAAERAGVRRVIYLGGLGDVADNLSKHLASRQEVAAILKSGAFKATILRAANIIGAGGAPFEMLRHLVERLPVLIAPRWIDTRCQPLDIHDAVAYLVGCLDKPETEDAEFDIGGPEIITYRKIVTIYARVRGLKRVIVSTPFLIPVLYSIWVGVLTPVPTGVARPLLEGLKNEVICRENRIRDIIALRLTPLEVSICNALQEVSRGPGKIISRQSCFLSGEY